MNHPELTLETAHFVTSRRAADPLSALTPAQLADDALLTTIAGLRRQFTPAEAGALITQARLRIQARAKFTASAHLFFTADALEQATHEEAARRRARRIHTLAPPGPVLDLGCGIGGDTLALAEHRPVIAHEQDPARAHLAAANAAALGLSDRVDVRAQDWTVALAQGELPAAAAAFIDPARRRDGRRLMHFDALIPGPEWYRRVAEQVVLVAVKVMPGIKDDEIPADCAVEFIGHTGQCKEAVLWYGRDAGARWADVHHAGCWHTLQAHGLRPPVGPLECGMSLHEPHPAVIRAGAFAELCDALDAHLFDPQIAYMVSPETKTHPLVQSFIVDEIAPFSLKQLNRRLRARGIGSVELKKRGFPMEPEQLRPRLTLQPGGPAAVVIFSRRATNRLMILARRAQPAQRESTQEESSW